MSFLLGISALELAAWLAPVQLRREADLRGKIREKHVTDLDSHESALACLILPFLSLLSWSMFVKAHSVSSSRINRM